MEENFLSLHRIPGPPAAISDSTIAVIYCHYRDSHLLMLLFLPPPILSSSSSADAILYNRRQPARIRARDHRRRMRAVDLVSWCVTIGKLLGLARPFSLYLWSTVILLKHLQPAIRKLLWCCSVGDDDEDADTKSKRY